MDLDSSPDEHSKMPAATNAAASKRRLERYSEDYAIARGGSRVRPYGPRFALETVLPCAALTRSLGDLRLMAKVPNNAGPADRAT
jgi:hypothetical protein